MTSAPEQSPPTPNPPENLPRGLVMAYGGGQVADSITNYLLTALLLFYYTSVLGLSGELAGIALMVGLIFDAITDPLVAALSDRTSSRWGRRHPYILASAIPLSGGLLLAFRPPPFVTGQAGLFTWLIFITVVIRTALTLLDVPHLALGAELTREYDERTRVVMVRNLFGMFGTAAIAAVYFLSFSVYEKQFPEASDVRLLAEPYEMLSLTASVACGVFIVTTVLGTLRAIPWLGKPRTDELAGPLFVEALRDLVKTLRMPAFRMLVILVALITTAADFPILMQTHLALYFWHVDLQIQSSGAFHLALGTGLGMVYWRQLAKRWDKKPALLTGIAFGTFFAIFPPLVKIAGLLREEATFWVLTFYNQIHFMTAFGFAALAVLSASMMADVSDRDELDSGVRRQGIFFAAFSFVNKVAHGVGAAIAGFLYDFVGLAKGMTPAEAPPAAGTHMVLATSILILLLVGAGTYCIRHYDLGREQHEAIRVALEARARKEQA